MEQLTSKPPPSGAQAGSRSWLRRFTSRLETAPRGIGLAVFLAWCALIFAISAQPAPDLGFSFRPLNASAHNLMHAPEYAVFALLFAWATARRGAALTSGKKRILLIVVAVLVYAASDEWHQSFTPGRDASVCDVLTDLCGGTSAALLLRALETSAPRGRIARIVLAGVLACAAAALIATFLPARWPDLGWL